MFVCKLEGERSEREEEAPEYKVRKVTASGMCGWHSPLHPLVGGYRAPANNSNPTLTGQVTHWRSWYLEPPSFPKARVRPGCPPADPSGHNPLTCLANREPGCSPWTRRRISKQLLVSASSVVKWE